MHLAAGLRATTFYGTVLVTSHLAAGLRASGVWTDGVVVTPARAAPCQSYLIKMADGYVRVSVD